MMHATVPLWVGILLVIAAVVITTVAYKYYELVQEAKAEVNAAPRIPMHMCPKHGAYPAKYTIPLTVPQEGREDLVVEQCIFCYDEKMKQAEKIFKT